ncbi:hypothetical protein E2P63_00300 [Candidatus Bathyarchaeota archaeon]|nr:hypothetical protein E2P63_00300 [Candidatus Bathyarchaeota archaeon]
MMKLRIDVDYPYPSRLKSFLWTALNIMTSKDYLKNSKIIARMINESPKQVKAYWFFTPKTVPDRELLDMLDKERHVVALHVVNSPYKEMKLLEKAAGRRLNYYTIHGTARLLARAMWKRWKTNMPEIPKNFPLESFHQFPHFGLDWLCYKRRSNEVLRKARRSIVEGKVLQIHPIWLFQRGIINHRGPFYKALRRILEVDKELETIKIRRKIFFKIASDSQEYARDIFPKKDLIENLGNTGADIFTFIERKWCNTLANPPRLWEKAEDNIALIEITSYNLWWENIGKKTRNMVRKAEKSGIKTEIIEPNEKLAEGIWKIYNETPIRQERAFPHYGMSLQAVKRSILSARNFTFIGAFLKEELAGFIQLIQGDKIAIISQILSLQRYFDKAVNNALVAKAVEFCANKKSKWIMYGRMGNHPSLDKFKQNNGFSRFPLIRYYIPITKKGRIAIKMGLHRETKDVIPQTIRFILFPVYNWVSRNKIRFLSSLTS